MSYNEFASKLDENKIDDLNFQDIKIQKYYVEYSIKKNNNIENSTLFQNFKKIAKQNLSLTKSQISKIRNKLIDNYKNLNLNDLLE